MSFHQAAASLSGSAGHAPSPTSSYRSPRCFAARHMPPPSSVLLASSPAVLLGSSPAAVFTPGRTTSVGSALADLQFQTPKSYSHDENVQTPAPYEDVLTPTPYSSRRSLQPGETSSQREERLIRELTLAESEEGKLLEDLELVTKTLKAAQAQINHLMSEFDSGAGAMSGIRMSITSLANYKRDVELELAQFKIDTEREIAKLTDIIARCDIKAQELSTALRDRAQYMEGINTHMAKLDQTSNDNEAELPAVRNRLDAKRKIVRSIKFTLNRECPGWEMRNARDLSTPLKNIETFEDLHEVLGFRSVSGFWNFIRDRGEDQRSMEEALKKVASAVTGLKHDERKTVPNPIVGCGLTHFTSYIDHYRLGLLYGRLMKTVFIRAGACVSPLTGMTKNLAYVEEKPAGKFFMKYFCDESDIDNFTMGNNKFHSLERRVMRLSLFLGLAVDTVLRNEKKDKEIPPDLEIPEVLKTPGYGFD